MAAAAEEGGGRGCGGGGGVGGLGAPSHSRAHAHDASNHASHEGSRAHAHNGTQGMATDRAKQGGSPGGGRRDQGAQMRCASAAGRRTLQRHGSSFEYLHGWRDDDA